jgi:lysophospholipase L1-like esterase
VQRTGVVIIAGAWLLAFVAACSKDTAGKNAASNEGGTGGTGSPGLPDSPGARYVGRFDARDPAGVRVGWPGARVLVQFEGTSLTAKLSETFGSSGYDVMIDGNLQPAPLFPAAGTTDHVLATGLASGPHVVELWRRTEGKVSSTQFRAFEAAGGKLLLPPAPKSRRIEFVGDSSINGYGIECTSAYDNFSAQTQNEHKAYPALVSTALSAEHANVSYSGKGVLRNISDSDKETFASLYTRATPEEAASTWSFSSWVPDLVFVALGGNDFYASSDRPPPDLGAFKAKYHELIALIRSKNEGASIVCSVEGRITNAEPVGYNALTSMTTVIQAVVNERNASGDGKVSYFELPRADTSGTNGAPDVTGCNSHTNTTFHQKAAVAVTAKIKEIMRW